METNRGAHRHHFTASPDNGGLAILVRSFDREDLRAPIAPPERGRETRRYRFPPRVHTLRNVTPVLRQDLPGIALRVQVPAFEPPDLVAHSFEQTLIVRGEKDRGPGAPQALKPRKSAGPNHG